ncbi:MAG: PEGA domain-containing protein, partial [Pseudohongiellaceae bacterium]
MDNNNDIRSPGTSDLIVPIDFTPNTRSKRRIKISFRPVHAVIGIFLAISGFAVWYILTAKSVYIEVDPFTAEIEIEGGMSVQLGPRYLIHPGVYELSLRNEGYHDGEFQLFVTQDQSQTHPYRMRKLPGLVSIAVLNQQDSRVQIDGVDMGAAPLTDLELEAGNHEVMVSKERYRSNSETIAVEGRSLRETFEFELEPAWATVTLGSNPPGAEVLVDGALVGVTPLAAEILEGEREITLKLAGYKAWQEEFEIRAANDFSVQDVVLEPADGLVFIRSNPSDASVTIDGEFKGNTPLEVALPPGDHYTVTLFKAGYESGSQSIRTEPDQETVVNLSLQPVMASVVIQAQPTDAQLYVNGELRGSANQKLELMAVAQQIEIRKSGYVPYTTVFTSRPGLDQVINVSLKSEEQARLEQIKPEITTAAGQTLKLFYPRAYTMGASRREAGRRPNETLREIILQKPFYFSLTEVTNGEYKQFKRDHSSGTFQQQSLDSERQPVVRVTWQDAALYCNWLSQQESLPLFYRVEGDEIVGFNPEATGYRLPSEAEWEWIARARDEGDELRYSWGEQLPPPQDAGNFADLSARAFLGDILTNYNDSYIGAAPVGQFTVNHRGVFDLAGNVAEWVHDNYGAVGNLGGAPEVDPLGP